MIKFFIVDDDASILKLYSIFLKYSGFEVIGSAINGEEAVRKFKNLQNKPDIIIMDYNMPIKNGIDATKEIIEIDKNAKIVVVSGDNSIKKEAISVGAIDFNEKPFKLTELHQKLIDVYENSFNNTMESCCLNEQVISLKKYKMVN